MNHNPLQTDWSRYWASGALHSCVGSYSGNYSGAIRAFWQEAWLNRLEASHRTLDLGCGNGPLAQMLTGASAQWSSYLGLDLAEVSPTWVGSLDATIRMRLVLKGSTDMTQSGQPDGAFDWVVSQFGAEYADQTALLKELDRLLKPCANLALCVHHAEGRLAQVAQEELGHGEWLLSGDGLWTATAQMIEPMALAQTLQGRRQLERSAAALQARERFNRSQDVLSSRASESSVPDWLFQMREASVQILGMAQQRGPAAARAAWEDRAQEVRQALARHRELLAAALSPEQAAQLGERLLALRQNWQGRVKPILEGPYLVGWGLSFHSTRSSESCQA